jgi:hypothetical protein
MTRRLIELDFTRSRKRPSRRGLAILGTGVVALLLVLIDYRSVAARTAGLEWRVAALRNELRPAKTDKAALRAEQDADIAISDLTTPSCANSNWQVRTATALSPSSASNRIARRRKCACWRKRTRSTSRSRMSNACRRAGRCATRCSRVTKFS